jgi:hypothetical protein
VVRIRPIPKLVVRPDRPGRAWRIALAVALAWVAAVGAAWVVSGRLAAPQLAQTRTELATQRSALAERTTERDEARARLAVSERAAQVAQAANDALQETLREREQEVAALRADLGFYQRLVGGSDRRTLGVHTIVLKPMAGGRAFGFQVTLTQNLKKSALTEGTATLAVEGVRDGRAATVPWTELGDGKELRFAFKYFQRLEGNLTLPGGFEPSRILVTATSSGGERAEQAVAWAEALAVGENDHAGP